MPENRIDLFCACLIACMGVFAIATWGALMGVFSELDMTSQRLEAVTLAMEDFVEAETAEIQMERRIDALVRDLDELCAFAANPETVDLVQAHRAGGFEDCEKWLVRRKAVKDFMAKYNIASDEIWEVHGSTWVVKHKALERVAAEQGIVWDRPAMLECNSANGVAAMCVFGKLGERLEWSIGEALTVMPTAPEATTRSLASRPAYVYAMAEKRAKDRVILKLLNAHGSLYSEEEADDFRRPEPARHAPRRYRAGKMQKEIQATGSIAELQEWAATNKDRLGSLKPDWQDFLRGVFAELTETQFAA
jgi:hypothetical protein